MQKIELMQSKLIKEGDKPFHVCLLQTKEIMGVLHTKFDSLIYKKTLPDPQIFVIWAWIYGIWSVKNYFLKIHIVCASAIMECQRICINIFFRILHPNIPKCTWDPKNLFLWIWSSNIWLLLGAFHFFWNIMHHGIIRLKVGTKTYLVVVSGNYL